MNTDPQANGSSEMVQATFSMLLMSLASTAALGLGLSPHPQTNETKVDLPMAKFNIDLLVVLQEKTTGNLTAEESHFLQTVLQDLQMRYVQSVPKKS